MRHIPPKLLLLMTLALLVGCGAGEDVGVSAPPLAAPENVRAEPGPGYVTVSWDDVSDDETGFAIYREPVTPSALATQQAVEIGSVPSDTSSFVDTTVDAGSAYRYSVAALGAAGHPTSATASSANVTLTPGVDLMAGTLARFEASGTGSAFAIWLFFPTTGVAPEEVTLTLTGPAGWNDGEAVTFSPPQAALDDGWVTFSMYSADAVEGDYHLLVEVASGTFEATGTLVDETYRLPAPQDVVTVVGPESVEVSWSGVEGAVSYSVALWEGRYDAIVRDYEPTHATEHTFDGLALAPGEYLVEVAAFPIDQAGMPVNVSPYGLSYAEATLTIPPLGAVDSAAPVRTETLLARGAPEVAP